jgi:hypothetical protein
MAACVCVESHTCACIRCWHYSTDELPEVGADGGDGDAEADDHYEVEQKGVADERDLGAESDAESDDTPVHVDVQGNAHLSMDSLFRAAREAAREELSRPLHSEPADEREPEPSHDRPQYAELRWLMAIRAQRSVVFCLPSTGNSRRQAVVRALTVRRLTRLARGSLLRYMKHITAGSPSTSSR